jgi:hypothetical protein
LVSFLDKVLELYIGNPSEVVKNPPAYVWRQVPRLRKTLHGGKGIASSPLDKV